MNVTYDSSGIYKQVMHARFMHVKDEEGYIRKMNIKSNNIHTRFLPNLSVNDTCQKIFDELSEKWNLGKISIDGIYNPETNTLFEDVKVYSILYTFNIYA